MRKIAILDIISIFARLLYSCTERLISIHVHEYSMESLEMKGLAVYYNFITKHQAIDCCPYELAVPELKDKLTVNNKWLALINLSSQNI